VLGVVVVGSLQVLSLQHPVALWRLASDARVVNTEEFLRDGFRSRRRPWGGTPRYPLRDRVIILLSVRAYIEGSSDAKRRST
jgi:hypothetical protein